MARTASEYSSSAFACLLRERRAGAGLTQAALAKRAGITARTIQQLEAGVTRPSADTTQRLSDALGLSNEEHAAFLRALRPRPAVAPRSRAELLSAYPVPLSSFVGRANELKQIRERLTTTRLLTLTGPGGIGKTRIALELVRADLEDPGADIVFVDLAPVSDPNLVVQTIAAAARVQQQREDSPTELLLTTLRYRPRVLLLLDNCEHLIDACSQILELLLRACPNVRVLTTSREPLQIDGEMIRRVGALSAEDAQLSFLERAQAGD